MTIMSSYRNSQVLQLPKPPLRLLRNQDYDLISRAVAQAVSRWLPTAAARVRVRAACGVWVDKEALGQVFSEYFGSPANHSTNVSTIIIPRAGTISLLVAAVPSGPS
jgi:hypothetical protein